MRISYLIPLGLTVIIFGACTDREVVRHTEKSVSAFDNKLRATGRFCTSNPADMVFPLKIFFIVDTSQSMNNNDPINVNEIDPTRWTGRSKAIRQVISQYVNLNVQYSNKTCVTSAANKCSKTDFTLASTPCAECGDPPAYCIGPDCCTAEPCHGYPRCPIPPATNGVCAPICDVKKSGCQPGESNCPDCPNAGDRCLNGICGKHLDPWVEFAVMRFGSAKQVLTVNSDKEEGFTNNINELVSALSMVNNGGSVTDYEGALTKAYSMLSNDMKRMQDKNIAAMDRTKYVIVFLSDGTPDPIINDEQGWNTLDADLRADLFADTGGSASSFSTYNLSNSILRKIKDIMALKFVYGIGEIHFHTAFLAMHENQSVLDQATALLKSMANLGDGTFRNFTNGEDINFMHVDFSSLKRVFALRSFLASNINARPSPGTFKVDTDGDGLSDEEEALLGTNKYAKDSDNDGFADFLENFYATSGWDPLNPSDADCPLELYDQDGDLKPDDSDGDGLSDCEERFIGTNRLKYDSDGDGIGDGLELLFRTNPITNDLLDDLDFDGLPNGEEIRLHCDPRVDDATHRSQMSYQYLVKKDGTGLEIEGLKCQTNADCPGEGTCEENYCRCVDDNSCSSRATCNAQTTCPLAGESCYVDNVCRGKWTCQPALPGLKSAANVCAMSKYITCYTFDVQNISLVTPAAAAADQPAGWNNVHLMFSEAPFDDVNGNPNYYQTCIKAQFIDSSGYKYPPNGIITVPETAWKEATKFNLAECVCPDGSVGTCVQSK